MATELFQEDDDEGHGIAGFEFKTSGEAHRFLGDVLDFQFRHVSKSGGDKSEKALLLTAILYRKQCFRSM